MAITQRGEGSASASTTSASVTPTSTVAADDIVVVFGYQRATTTALSVAATGLTFTAVVTPTGDTTYGSLGAWWARYPSTTNPAITVTGSSGTNLSIGIIVQVCRGVDTSSSPLTNIGSITNQASASTHTVTGPTGLSAGTAMVGLAGSMDNNALSAYWTGTGTAFGVITNDITAGADACQAIAIELPSGGTCGDFTAYLITNGPDAGRTLIFGLLEATANATGTANLTGSGTVTAAASVIVSGTANLTGSGTVTAAASVIVSGTASVTGTGSVTATGGPPNIGTPWRNSAPWRSSMTWRGVAGGASTLNGTATVVGSGSVSAAATQIKRSTSTVTGAGAVSGSASVVAPAISGTATVMGTGTVTGVATKIIYGTASVAGTGAVTGAGSKIHYGTATLTGAGSVTAEALQTLRSTATLLGQGAVTGDASVQAGAINGTATVAGTGVVTGAGTVIKYGSATITGAGTVSAAATQIISGTSTVVGTGAVSAAGTIRHLGAATVSGVGAVSATASQVILGTATVTGEGSVAAAGGIPGGETFADAVEAIATGLAGDPSPWVVRNQLSDVATAIGWAYNTTTNGWNTGTTFGNVVGVAYNATTPTVAAIAQCAEATVFTGDAYEIYAEVAVAEASIALDMPTVISNSVDVYPTVATAIGQISELYSGGIGKSLWKPFEWSHEGDVFESYTGLTSWDYSEVVPPGRYVYGDMYGQDEGNPNETFYIPDSTFAAHGKTSAHVGITKDSYGDNSQYSGGQLEAFPDERYEAPFEVKWSAYFYFSALPPAEGNVNEFFAGNYLAYMVDQSRYVMSVYLHGSGIIALMDGPEDYYITSNVPIPVQEWVRMEFWVRKGSSIHTPATASSMNALLNDEVGYAFYHGDETVAFDSGWFESRTDGVGDSASIFQMGIGLQGKYMVEHWMDSVQIVDAAHSPGGDIRAASPWPYLNSAYADVAIATGTAGTAIAVDAECAIAYGTATKAIGERNAQVAQAKNAWPYSYHSLSPTLNNVQGDQHTPEQADVAATAFNPAISISATPDAQVAAATGTAYTIIGTDITPGPIEAIAVGTANTAASANTYVLSTEATAAATAYNPSIILVINAALSSGAVTAYQPTTTITPVPAVAQATGTAPDAEVIGRRGAALQTPSAFFVVWAPAPTIKTGARATVTTTPNMNLTAVVPAIITYQYADAQTATASVLTNTPAPKMGGGVSAPAPSTYISAPRPRVTARRRTKKYTVGMPVELGYMGVGRLFYRMDRDVGISLLVENGVVNQAIGPSQDRIALAEHYYPGGHVNVFSQDEADILTAAGYLVTETDPDWVEEVLT